jgi:asparagine synthase (glutamine-hydrolysing)
VFLPAGRLGAEKGIPLRFPYADSELVQWLERLPARYRLEGETGKRLHREALCAWLPAEVLARPKTDFGYAVRRWIRERGRAKVEEWLLGSNAWVPSVLDGVRVRGVIDRACQNRGPVEPLILLIHLELWARVTFLGEIR